MTTRKKRLGFTLVELLVVIGIIAVLIGILLPSLMKAKASANDAACKSNLRQIVTAMLMYANDNRNCLPNYGYMDSTGTQVYYEPNGTATFASNLYPDADGAHTKISVSEAMTNLIQSHQVPASKVVMGMTFWANRFRVDHLGDSFTKNTKGVAENIEYARAVDLFSTGRYTMHRDATADSVYLTRDGGGCVVAFDDPQSIRDKAAFAKNLGCAGVMMWNAYADLGSGQSPLLDAIAAEYDLPTTGSDAALALETTQLAHKVLPTTQPSDVQTLNDQLRKARGLADDDRWIAAATQPTTKP